MVETKKNNTVKKDMPAKTVKTETVKKVATKVAVKEDRPVIKTTEKRPVKAKKSAETTYATGKRKNAIAKVWLSKGT